MTTESESGCEPIVDVESAIESTMMNDCEMSGSVSEGVCDEKLVEKFVDSGDDVGELEVNEEGLG